MSTMYLQNKFSAEKIPVDSFSVHPGLVDTDLFQTTPLKKLFPWLPSMIFKVIDKYLQCTVIYRVGLTLFQNSHKGATPIVYASVSKELEHKGGTYLSNCEIVDCSPYAKNVESQKILFELSKTLVNIKEFGIVD